MSSCTWKPNPLFKSQPEGAITHYTCMWYNSYFTTENCFPQLHDSPMVPEDLKCLSSCFEKYQQYSDLMKKVQQKCSANGIDRQIPTHLKEGTEMVETSFESIFANDCEGHLGPCLASRIFNPNLDCLMYYETKERTECGTGGVCNYIPQFHTSKIQNHRNLYGIATYTSLSTIYTQKLLRSSSPYTRALKLCALAKLIQWYREGGDDYYHSFNFPESMFTTQKVKDLFSGDYKTCDKFMPDIFGTLCSCVGTCAPTDYDPTSDAAPPENLIHHFETDNGLWECQDACRRKRDCKFYTHSSFSKYFPRSNYHIFHCLLWKSCDTFHFSKESVFPGTYTGSHDRDAAISENHSGPRYCFEYDQKCPVVAEGEGFQVKY